MNLQNIKENLFIVIGSLSVLVCVLIIGVISLAAWWSYQSVDSPVTIINPENHQAVYVGNDFISIHREFIVHRSTEFTAKREMIQLKPDGTLIKIELPNLTVTYIPGQYKTERLLEVPGSIFGKFRMINRLCWHANPIRVDCIDQPILAVEIVR